MPDAAEFRTVADKAHAALMPVMNYLWPLDLATAALMSGRAGALPHPPLVRDAVASGSGDLVLLVVVLGVADAFKGTFDLDTRFIMMAAFVVPAALVPLALPAGPHGRSALGFLLLFSARMAVCWWSSGTTGQRISRRFAR